VAIKGKSRSKAKGKQVSRAPRREPVRVKPPFFMRRWVQITTSAVAGALAVLLVFWVVRGLHNDRATNEKNAANAKRVAAASKWETAVGGALSPVATQGQSGAPPNLFVGLGPSLAALAGGTAPKGTAASIKKVTDGVTTASAALAKFNLATTMKDQGFTAAEINSFIYAQALIDQSLTLYGKSAASAKLALAAQGGARKQLAAAALADLESGTALFQQGWQGLLEGLLESGVNLSGGAGTGSGAGVPSP
jgi:hypothetical protein